MKVTRLTEAQAKKLEKDVLMEGPLDALKRKASEIKTSVMTAQAKSEAKNNRNKWKDDVARRDAKALKVLSKDFLPDHKDAKFYLNHDYAHPIQYDDWCKRFENVSDADYPLWHNAIVVDKDGYYIRRGAEDFSHRLTRFISEVDDEVLKAYRVEPYTYNVRTANDRSAERVTKADEEQPTAKEEESTKKSTKETQEVTPEEDKKPAGKKRKNIDAEAEKKPAPKKTAPIADKDLRRFYELSSLTNLQVYSVEDPTTPLTQSQVKQITSDTLSNYVVRRSNGRKEPLGDWIQKAKNKRFLEHFHRAVSKTLNEGMLVEAPRFTIDTDKLMDPSEVNFSKMLADKADKERQRKEKERRDAELANARDYAEKVLADFDMNASVVDKLDFLHSNFVPTSGMADTQGGEMIRAMMRIMYRDYNDGDVFYMGYGLETCGSSAAYLMSKGYEEEFANIAEQQLQDQQYTDALTSIADDLVTRLASDNELMWLPNSEDSREFDYSELEQNQPTFDACIYVSDDVGELLDNGIINSVTVSDYIENELSFHTDIGNFSIERPWNHDDREYNISGLTREGLEIVDEINNNPDNFFADLVVEYEDELNSDEDEDFEESVDDEELEENLTPNSLQSTVIGFNDYLEMVDPRSARALESVPELLEQRHDKVVVFEDHEWMYDPTSISPRGIISEVPKVFNCYDMILVGAVVNHTITLFFKNTEDATRYMEYYEATF